MPRVVVIGGGTGGTMVANALDKRRFDVTLLSASPMHLFQPALLYVAFKHAKPDALREERRLLDPRVRLVQETVTHVNLKERVVTTGGGIRYDYDSVVLATGVTTDSSQIPGLADVEAQFGNFHSNVAQAEKLWAALDAFRGGTIALGQSTPICKCPPSPVEGILLTDHLLRQRGLREKTRLVLFTPYPRAYPAEPMNAIIEPILKERGIEIMTFFDVDRVDPASRTIHSIEGDQIQYDLPVIIPPFVGTRIAYEPANVVDASGFIVTDKVSLRVQGTDTAFAIGDATNLPTSKAGVGAHLEAKVVAKTLMGEPAAFDGRTHCPVDLGDGRGTFVIGSYTSPVVKYPPSRLNHFMKMMMGRIYWMSLRGTLEPIFDWYFERTRPERLIARAER
ncbi:MAG TPA: FAD-dependent oxidoreductase [Candidatus Dormibacteraeota bacterium]|nr:FAD-dependent oxidoreductase [Candidatus Dormibacteraeota bacterium]